ncbi:hypothetical protein ACTJKN_07305 [Pedobacter sp. 22163]|uniref:hypothetical protein n=1 Tax=Pedobacter sp. 22163 TaxID=3453883 RepID=UPI003F85143E
MITFIYAKSDSFYKANLVSINDGITPQCLGKNAGKLIAIYDGKLRSTIYKAIDFEEHVTTLSGRIKMRIANVKNFYDQQIKG